MASTPSARAETRWKPRAEQTVLNADIRRLDGPLKVTGAARYSHDVRVPNMVYARLLLCPYPRAKIAKIDVEPARAVPGVVYAEPLKDVASGEGVLYQGDDSVLAVVAAETPEAAEDGLRAIVVEAEELLPPVVTVEQALEPDSPPVGPGGRGGGGPRRESEPATSGDETAARAALEACDVVVDATYRLPVQHHACLETHGMVVEYRGGEEATVYASTQAVSGLAGEAAQALGLARERVRVVTQHMGGGFGSKFSLGLEGGVACRAARDLGRPVHLMLTRKDEFLMAGNRSGSIQHMVGGASADGAFKALVTDCIREGGQGGGALPSHPYIYSVESAFHMARSVYTALDSSRAMRAPGHPQASFAIESMVDELAYAIGMDPLEFRMRNLEDEVYHRQLGRVADEIGWGAHPHKTAPGKPDAEGHAVGIGFGVSVWGGQGRPPSSCGVRIQPDGSISASICTQDLGTGVRTLVAAIVAEELGLRPTDVTPRIGDSDLPPSAGSGGSVTTGSVAPPVKEAAHAAREALEAKVAVALNCDPAGLRWKDRQVFVEGEPSRALTWEQACATLGEPLSVRGEWRAELTGRGVHGAQAARVRVDALTGAIHVEKMVCVQDSGLVFNRLAYRSQVNGGMIQALSYGLLEQRVFDPDLGLMLTANLEDYKIAGALEIGEIVAIPDDDDPRQEAIGMAEAPVIPGHGAIANAVFNACGVRIRELPLTPDKVLMGLAERS